MCGDPIPVSRQGKCCSEKCTRARLAAKAKEYLFSNRAINTATMLASILLNGCPVCGPVEFIDTFAFAFHHFDPAKKDGLLGLGLAPRIYNAGLAAGAHLHLGCHVRLHCSRHLGKWEGLRPPLPGESRESQLYRIAAACRAEVEEERRSQGFFS